MSGVTEYLSAADTAKLVRKALKASFPDTKFSVRSETYAGGASIDVAWIDGPRDKEVDQALEVYKGADFDGMIDLKSYRPPVVLGDAAGNLRSVRFGADFIFTRREYSPGFWWDAAKKVAERWDFDPTVAPPYIRPSFRFPKRLVCSSLEGTWAQLRIPGNVPPRDDFNTLVRIELETDDSNDDEAS